jgi:hypothetical protein
VDRGLLEAFIREIDEQCIFALNAAGGINAGLQSGPSQDQIWLSIRALLTAAANISKCLWPTENRSTRSDFPDRGEALRGALDVEDDSPLSNRDLRNHFEHMDERLETWWLEDPHHNIARRIIGPFDRTIVGLAPGSMFEQFDPDTARVAFRGDTFELQPLVDEISQLKSQTTRFLSHRRP